MKHQQINSKRGLVDAVLEDKLTGTRRKHYYVTQKLFDSFEGPKEEMAYRIHKRINNFIGNISISILVPRY